MDHGEVGSSGCNRLNSSNPANPREGRPTDTLPDDVIDSIWRDAVSISETTPYAVREKATLLGAALVLFGSPAWAWGIYKLLNAYVEPWADPHWPLLLWWDPVGGLLFGFWLAVVALLCGVWRWLSKWKYQRQVRIFRGLVEKEQARRRAMSPNVLQWFSEGGQAPWLK